MHDVRNIGLVKSAVIVGLLILACHLPASAFEHCGNPGPVPEMTIGEIQFLHSKKPPIISSAEAIAAIVRTSTVSPVAWILWDQTGAPWIMVKTNSPRVLAGLVKSSKPIYANGHFIAFSNYIAGIYGIYGREVTLPTGYELLSCVSVK